MKNTYNYQIIIYLIISLIFIILTTTFYNFDQSLIYGAADGKTYMQIAESSPNFSLEKEPYHKAQRFIISYFIGLISFVTNIEIYILFRGLTLILILSILSIFYKIFKRLNIGKYQQIFLFSLIIFNPYFVRYFLALPTLINDLVFIFAGTLLLLFLLEQKKIYLFLSILLGSISRINVIFFLIALIIGKIFYRKKIKLSVIDIIISITIFYLIHLTNNYHASIIGHQNNEAYTLHFTLGLFFNDYSFKELIIFVFFPILNFLPIILIPFLFKIEFDFKKIIHKKIVIISLLIILMIAIIAYAAGPIITGKNIIRLINLSYPFILFVLLKFFDNQSRPNNLRSVLALFFLIIWSFHPTYSNIDFFTPLKEMLQY